MEKITKKNYNDTGKTGFENSFAKVWHVNELLSNNTSPSEPVTEYYINGAIIHFVNNFTAVTVDSHNTPVRNIDHLGLGINSYEGVLGFQHSGNGVYAFFFQGTSNITADVGNGFETCNITAARLSSIIINPDPQIRISLNATGKPYVSTTIVPYPQSDGVVDSFIADLSVLRYDPALATTNPVELPQPNQMRRIFNFQLKFSEFTVVPA